MSRLFIFRTISYKQHFRVWEHSGTTEYDNNKTQKNLENRSKWDTIGQILEWYPNLLNNVVTYEDDISIIGLYSKKYFEQGNIVYNSYHDEFYPSLLKPKSFPGKNYFIEHNTDLITLSFDFVRKIKTIDSESVGETLCRIKDKYIQSRNCNIGKIVNGHIIYPLLFEVRYDSFKELNQNMNWGIDI